MARVIVQGGARRESATEALRGHRFLMRVAFTAANLFAWIFIFQYFFTRTGNLAFALLSCALLYALAHDIALLLTPLSAQRIRNGTRAPMLEAVALASLSFAMLGAAFAGLFGDSVFLGVLGYALLYGAYRALYWVPYEVDVAKVASGTSITSMPFELFYACLPAIAGALLASGYPAQVWLMWVASALLCLSLIPLTRVPDVHEGFSWGYGQTFHELFSTRHRTLVLTALVDGVSGGALLIFWPIAAFLIVGWSYVILGLALTITFLVVMLTRATVRTLFASMGKRSPFVYAALAASSWVLRLVVASPIGIVLVDSYFYTGSSVRGTGIDPMLFEQTADRGSYIDELTALKEIALSIGKVAICLFGASLAATSSLPITFIGVFLVAAAASAISAYLSRSNLQSI